MVELGPLPHEAAAGRSIHPLFTALNVQKHSLPRVSTSSVQTTVVDYARSAAHVAQILDGYRERIDITLSPNDEMFNGDLEDYLGVAETAIAQIAHAMALTGRTDCRRILDLPCGHGRVLRALRAVFTDAELIACDINHAAVDFCAAQFGALPVYSTPDPHEIPLDGMFDVIWVGSLLTHLDARRCRTFLRFFCDRLAPSGLLLVSTHGRNAVRRWPLEDGRLAQIRSDFEKQGFGYADHAGTSGYGTSAFTAAWLADELYSHDDVMLIGYAERGLADHQDLATIFKFDVHHRQWALRLR
jgi:SAM-dependent methyltransferase